MIRLTKTKKPEILEKNEAEWTKTLQDRIENNKKPTETEKSRYRHPDIKSALVSETFGKCAYCESKLRHVTPGDVEHITPKSVAVDKTFLWENLTLACDVCNTNKSNHFGNHDHFVDPYQVEPTDHFLFAGPLILALATSTPGQLTESVLKLNRADLVERRIERIKHLTALVQNLVRVDDPELKEVLRMDIQDNETKSHQEYAGLSREFVSSVMSRLTTQ